MSCYHMSEMKAKPKSTERKLLAAADWGLRESARIVGPLGSQWGWRRETRRLGLSF